MVVDPVVFVGCLPKKNNNRKEDAQSTKKIAREPLKTITKQTTFLGTRWRYEHCFGLKFAQNPIFLHKTCGFSPKNRKHWKTIPKLAWINTMIFNYNWILNKLGNKPKRKRICRKWEEKGRRTNLKLEQIKQTVNLTRPSKIFCSSLHINTSNISESSVSDNLVQSFRRAIGRAKMNFDFLVTLWWRSGL